MTTLRHKDPGTGDHQLVIRTISISLKHDDGQVTLSTEQIDRWHLRMATQAFIEKLMREELITALPLDRSEIPYVKREWVLRVISPHAPENDWFVRELAHARAQGIRTGLRIAAIVATKEAEALARTKKRGVAACAAQAVPDACETIRG